MLLLSYNWIRTGRNYFMNVYKGGRTSIFLLPGIGIILFPWARIHANDTWPGVISCLVATSWISSTSFKMFGKFFLPNLSQQICKKFIYPFHSRLTMNANLPGIQSPPVAFRNIVMGFLYKKVGVQYFNIKIRCLKWWVTHICTGQHPSTERRESDNGYIKFLACLD